MKSEAATALVDPMSLESSDSQKNRRVVVPIAIFALCMDALAVRSIVLLAPFIRSGLNLEEGQYGYVMAAIMAGTLLAVLPVGSLLDRFDARRAFPVILINVGLAFFVVSLQKSFHGLLVALFILGLLRAGIIPLVNRLITGRFAPTHRGAVMGIIYAAVPLGGFLGAIVLPTIAEYQDWQTGYRLLGLIALFGGLLSRNKIPNNEAVRSVQNTVRDLSPFHSATFLILAAAYGFYAFSLSADVYVTLFLVDVVKITAVAAGIFFGLIQLAGMGGRVFWGLLADRRFQENRMGLLAIINWLTVISFILLIMLDSSSKGWMIAVVMVVIGMSVASSWGILSTVLGDVVRVSSIAVATSVIFFITNIADMVGPILFGAILEATQSYQITIGRFMGVAVCTALTLTGLAWRGRHHHGMDWR
jgi:MFS family permease